MKWARAAAAALVFVAIVSQGASADVISTPGRYDVTVVAVPAFTPPGVPPLGPNVYPGELIVVEAKDGWKVIFRGDGDGEEKLMVHASFSVGWAGVTVGPLPMGPITIPNAVLAIDVAHLEQAHLIGEGLVGGVLQKVQAQVGVGGTVLKFNVH